MKLFGTDGIRGVAGKFPVEPETFMRVGNVWASQKESEGEVLVVWDTRASSPSLAMAVAAGLASGAADVVLGGVLTTPAAAFCSQSCGFSSSVVISASHNPWFYNGLKILKNGKKISVDEELKIEESILPGLHIKKDFAKISVSRSCRKKYIECMLQRFSDLDLSGLKIAVDCANGAATETAVPVFKELSNQVNFFNVNPDGKNINHNCGSTHPEFSFSVAKQGYDFVISYDGDGDRVLIVSGDGTLWDGDRLLAFFCSAKKQLEPSCEFTVVTTVLSNSALEDYLSNFGIRLVRTKVGDRWVQAEMEKHSSPIGGEPSGHIILSDFLSTGDGLVTSLYFLSLVQKGFWLKGYEPYYQEILSIPVPHPLTFEDVEELKEKIAKTVDVHRMVVRPSGTEPVIRVLLEDPSKQKLEEALNSIHFLFDI